MLIIQPKTKEYRAAMMNGFVGAGGLCSFKDNPLYVEENVLSIQMGLSRYAGGVRGSVLL